MDIAALSIGVAHFFSRADELSCLGNAQKHASWLTGYNQRRRPSLRGALATNNSAAARYDPLDCFAALAIRLSQFASF